MNTIRIALAQINPIVGDLAGNTKLIVDYIQRARAARADLVAVPELAVTGYPPEDLLLKPHFVSENRRALDRIAEACPDIVAIVGFVDADGSDIYNAAAVIKDGNVRHTYRKTFLPNYGVFDELRYFQAGSTFPVYQLGDARLGVNVCEDIWYPGGPGHIQALVGDAHVLVNISSSPYYAGKIRDRERMLCTRAEDSAVVLAYCNLVGGQDELVFDGNSLIIDEAGMVIARGASFEEDLVVADVDIGRVFSERLHDPRRRQEKARLANSVATELIDLGAISSNKEPLPPRVVEPVRGAAEVYAALVVGTRDYVRKNQFERIYLGLSGGIDSALTAVIAADALGPENVYAVYMPTRFSAGESGRDARDLAANLGIHYEVIPIEPIFECFLGTLKDAFKGLAPDATEENLQARVRGGILMALSNKFRGLVLSTGNKSEMSVGYSTLYGDMVGGFAVLKDVLKTTVYDLARLVNDRSDKPVIPEYIITRAPSAELRADQTDQDTLPPYPVLDSILAAYVEQDTSAQSIAASGFDPAIVRWVIDRVDAAEYKRRQSPPGIKITPRAFGRDRRVPITNKYHG